MARLLRDATAPLSSVPIMGLHLVLNSLLILGAGYWLLIPDAHAWQLLVTSFSALLIVALFLWLHTGTIIYARQPARENLRAAFSPRPLRWLWFLLGLGVLLWLMHSVDDVASRQYPIGGYLYSKAPDWLRPVHGSGTYSHALRHLLWLTKWYLLPGILFPITAARVIGTPLRSAWTTILSGRYWMLFAVAVFFGVWLVQVLLAWTPGASLKQQTVSLAIRFSVAYLLATAAWLLTAGILGYFASVNSPGSD